MEWYWACFRIKVRTDATEFADIRIAARLRKWWDLIGEGQMFIKYETKVACRMSGLKWWLVCFKKLRLRPIMRTWILEELSTDSYSNHRIPWLVCMYVVDVAGQTCVHIATLKSLQNVDHATKPTHGWFESGSPTVGVRPRSASAFSDGIYSSSLTRHLCHSFHLSVSYTSPEHQSVRMSKITNDGLTRSGKDAL